MLKNKNAEGQAEKRTEVVFYFEKHQLPYLKFLEEYVRRNKPDVIVLERPHEELFYDMLKGKISVKAYMENTHFQHSNPAFSKKKYELLGELYGEGVRVEPMLAEAVDELRSRLSRLRYLAAFQSELSITGRDFENAVSGRMDFARLLGVEGRLRDMRRTVELAERIKNGELKGKILVVVGSAHTESKNLLEKEFSKSDNVSISFVYPFRDMVADMFQGASEVYPPGVELARAYGQEHSKEKEICSRERKRLLGARDLIYSLISKDLQSSRGDELRNYEAVRAVNKLGYEDCKRMFEMIVKNDMSRKEAFDFVQEYVRR